MDLDDIVEEKEAIASRGLEYVDSRLYKNAQGSFFCVKDLFTFMATGHFYGQHYGIKLIEYMKAKNHFAELAPPNGFIDRLERDFFEKISPSLWINPNVKYDYQKEGNPRYAQFWNFVLRHTQLGKHSSELAILATLAHVAFYEHLRDLGTYHPENIFLPVREESKLTILSICPYFEHPKYGASGCTKADLTPLDQLSGYVPIEETMSKDLFLDTYTKKYYLSDLHIFKRYPCHIVLEWYSNKVEGENAKKIRQHIRKWNPW